MLDRGDPLVTALGLTNLFGCVCCREIGGKEVRRAGQAQVQFGEGAYAGLSPPDLEVQGVTALAAVLVVLPGMLALLQFADGAVIGTGGGVQTANQHMGIRHVMSIKSPADLAKVPIAAKGGKMVRLGDVANVVEDHQPLIGDAVVNGGPGLMLVVEKLPWANTLDVTRGVDEALSQLKPGLTDITVDASMDAEALRCAIRSTEPEGQCSSVGCHFSDIEIPMMEMYVRGIHFYTGRGQGRPNIEKAMAFLDARRFDASLVTTQIAAFDDTPEVLASGPMKAVLMRAAIHA